MDSYHNPFNISYSYSKQLCQTVTGKSIQFSGPDLAGGGLGPSSLGVTKTVISSQ